MSVGEGPQAEGGEAGLTGLALRLVVGALLIVAAIVVTQQWGAGERAARERFTPSAGTVRLPELTNPVEILRDARGVPHVIVKWLLLTPFLVSGTSSRPTVVSASESATGGPPLSD